MRNPFRRQTETAAPPLRERAANLRASLRPLPAASATLPAPGSAEARAAWEAVCREHSKRTQALIRHPELAHPQGGAWTTDTLNEALDFGVIKPADFARLYPMASEFELELEQIGHDLNIHALFALAHATEFPKEGEAAPDAPTEDTFPRAPTDLANACLWAVRHRAWIDGAMKVADWSDERFDSESAKTNAVFARAIDEPSVSLRDITAKAALALEDFERFTPRLGHKADNGTRIVHTVLREIAAFRAEAASPSDRDLGREAFAYAHGLDLSAVPLDCLLRLIDVFHREAEVLSDVSQEVRFYADANIRLQNDGGEIIEAESNRLGCLRDVCVQEVARRTPKTEADRDAILVSRVHHEMLCEMKIRNRALIAEIREAWGRE